MKVKIYKVELRKTGIIDNFFYVDAPSKRIARWCGANLFSNIYPLCLTARSIKATKYKESEGAK